MTTYGIVAALLLAQVAPSNSKQAAPAAAPAAAAMAPEVRVAPTATLPLAGPPVTLDDALREANGKNLDIAVAKARLDQSRQLHWKAWSYYLPQVTAAGSYTHYETDVAFSLPTAYSIRQMPANVPPPEGSLPVQGADTPYVLMPTAMSSSFIQKQNQWGAQVEAKQALFAPSVWFGIAAARAGERAAEGSIESARRQILFGAAQAYYGAAAQRQIVSIQERQLAIAMAHEKDARVRYKAGASPKVTFLRAEIDRARAEQDLKRAQNGFLSAKLALATLMGRKAVDFEVAIPPSPQPPADQAGLGESALRDRPDVLAAREQVTAATRARGSTYAKYLPNVGAFARWQWANLTGFSGKESSWAVGLGASWNILDGFLREAEIRENSAKVREAEAARTSAEMKAVQEVNQARLDLESAIANREKAKEQLALAQENQRLVDVNYRAGAATYLEVSDANGALNQAELGAAAEGLNADLAALRLLQAAGAFDPR